MKKYLIILLLFVLPLTSCSSKKEKLSDTSPSQNIKITNKAAKTLYLQTQNQTYIINVINNTSSASLTSLLPMEFTLSKHNNYFSVSFDNKLNASDTKITTINKGDILLYNGNTLMIFYKTIKSNKKYTKIGSIKDPNNIESELNSDNIKLSF